MISGLSEAPVKSNTRVDAHEFCQYEKKTEILLQHTESEGLPLHQPVDEKKCVNVLISHGFIGLLVKLFIRVYSAALISSWRTSGKEHKVEKMESSYRVTSV